MAKVNSSLIRVDPEMAKLVKRIIREHRLLSGKKGKKLTCPKVTRKIAKIIKERELLKDEFIKF